MSHSYTLLEAPISCGSPTTGAELAYRTLLRAGLNTIFADAHTLPMETLTPCETYPAHLIHLDTVVETNRRLRENVLSVLADGRYPIIIGGDHSIAMGSLAALGEQFGAENVAVVYIDAHADINTDAVSESHFIHGMDLAAACGLCCDALTIGKNKVNLLGKNLYILGSRSVDDTEYPTIREQGVHLYLANAIHQRGIRPVLDEILPSLHGKHVHISFDVDALDPSVFSATGYNIPGGLNLSQLEEILRSVLPLSCSFECVEYNPLRDPNERDLKTLLGIFTLVANLLQK